jgi:hypothetical protein
MTKGNIQRFVIGTFELHSSFVIRHLDFVILIVLTIPGRGFLLAAGPCEIPPVDFRILSAAARRVSVAPG